MPEGRGFQVVVGEAGNELSFYVRRKERKDDHGTAKRENCTTCEHWDLWYSECGKEEELKEWGVNKE